MTSQFYIEDELGSRGVEASCFPLSIGGPGADIHLPGIHSTEPVAHIGLSDEEIFVQPEPGGTAIVCNGLALRTSQWLRDGDVLSVGPARVVVRTESGSVHFRIERMEADPAAGKVSIEPALPEHPVRSDDVSATRIKPIPFEPKAIRSLTGARARSPGGLWKALFWSSLVILGAFLWFLFTARSVRVEIEPLPDRVDIEGSLFRLGWGDRYLLRPGSYTWVAEKDGYRRLEAPVEVTGERNQTFQFSLEKAPGRLNVSTVPVPGAEVLIDGESVGVTPLEAVELPSGEHGIEIRAERFRDFATRVIIKGGGSIETLDVELVPRWAAVTFNSEPAGARVLVDGEGVGLTPVTAEVMEGPHRYELLLDGHRPFSGRVKVEAGVAQMLPTARLGHLEGRLSLDTNPSGANVAVDGTFRGQTPLDLYLSPGEIHQISLSRLGYASQSFQVELPSGENRKEVVELEETVGVVEIACDPGDADLFVNGERRGRASQVLRLAAAPQQIEIRKEGYKSFSTTIMPKPGFPQAIEVILETVEEDRAKARPTIIKTSRGHELRLITERRFQMGASRREPGRRANETIREVEITRPYYIATREISNRQFREFKGDHKSGWVKGFSLENDDHPVVRVRWDEAAAYCNWLSEQESLPPAYVQKESHWVAVHPPATGYRLPTEAEWVGAARYPDGVHALKYPWGNALPVAPNSGNFADVSGRGLVPVVLSNYNDSFPVTAPVGSFPPNPLGLYDLGGNVAEWVQDHYTIYPSGRSEPERDPLGPPEGEIHVIRGAGWMHASVTELRLSYRDYGKEPRPDVGFRIARYAE